MSRREIREQIFKMLFRIEFHESEEMSEQMELFLEEEEIEENTYIQEKYQKIVEKLNEIDEAINEKVTGWKTSRMSKVDLALLRLAVYEICYDEEIPEGVAINEAVELAKRFGGETSGSFVNGILGKIANSESEEKSE